MEAQDNYGSMPLVDSATARLVQESWARLAGREDEVVKAFYARLFELKPQLEDLFVTTDMEHLRLKFADTIHLLLGLLDDPAALYGQAEQSGRRHGMYGVRDRDFRTGGEALLWAIAQTLGDDFTPEVRDAWAEAYTRVTHAMSRGRGP